MSLQYSDVQWYLKNNVLLYSTALYPPHLEVRMSQDEARELLRRHNAYFIRWTSDFDKVENGSFWYVIKDDLEDLASYSSKVRYQIKKGLKNCKVEKVSKEFIVDNGYRVYTKAFQRYKGFIQPLSVEEFKTNLLKSRRSEFFAVFKGDTLIGYSQNTIGITNNVANYTVVKIDPDYLSFYPSYALFFEMNRYYLNEKNFLYVHDGARNVSHQTNIHNFLIQKFNFRKAYCKLNVLYRMDIQTIALALYPFRKFFYRCKHSLCHKVAVLLRHEAIRRNLIEN